MFYTFGGIYNSSAFFLSFLLSFLLIPCSAVPILRDTSILQICFVLLIRDRFGIEKNGQRCIFRLDYVHKRKHNSTNSSLVLLLLRCKENKILQNVYKIGNELNKWKMSDLLSLFATKSAYTVQQRQHYKRTKVWTCKKEL